MEIQEVEVFGHKFKLTDSFKIKAGLIICLKPIEPFHEKDLIKFRGTIVGNKNKFKVKKAERFSRGFVPCDEGMNTIGLLVDPV